MSDISTHTITYGNLESDSRKRKQHGDSLKKRPASAKSRRELDHAQLGYRRRQHHGHHRHHGHRSVSPPLSEHKMRGGGGSLSFLYQDKESLRDFYLDQFRPKEGVPQWEHVDLTDGPSGGGPGGGANCTSLVPVDDFLKSKPSKVESKVGGGEWECRNCHASSSGSKRLAQHTGGGAYGAGGSNSCVASGAGGGASRPTSATCMRCDACKRTGNLYNISEDSNHVMESISGRGQTPSQRRRAFSARPLRRQHSYDAFMDLHRDDEGLSLRAGGGAMDDVGGTFLPPRSVSLKEKDRCMEGSFSHLFDTQQFYSPAHHSLSAFRGERDPYFLSKSLYPDHTNHNPFVPTFGDDQCLLHGAKTYYTKKQQRSDPRNPGNPSGISSFLPSSRFTNQHSALGPPRPFNGTNGHVYEKLSSIESDV